MSPAKQSATQLTARDLAFEVVMCWKNEGTFVRDAFDKLVKGNSYKGLSTPDRGFALRLSLATVLCARSCDDIIEPRLTQKRKLQDEIRIILWLGLCEMIVLKKEAYAAINEAVELAKRHAVDQSAPRQAQQACAGFVNGMLRGVAREIGKMNPKTLESFFQRFTINIFHRDVIQRLILTMDDDEFGDFCAAHLYDVTHFARAFDPRETLDLCAERKIQAKMTRLPGVVSLPNVTEAVRQNFDDLIVADFPAQWVASATARFAQGVDRVLQPLVVVEVGTGRATKTALILGELAAYAQEAKGQKRQILDRLQLVCVEPNKKRMREAKRRLNELKKHEFSGLAECIDRIVFIDKPFEEVTRKYLVKRGVLPSVDVGPQLILIDAPCSGLGTIRRNPELVHNITAQSIESLQAVQASLLDNALELINVQGTVLYSTCSVYAGENMEQVEAALKRHKQAYRVAMHSLMVHDPTVYPAGGSWLQTKVAPGSCDGHFCAALSVNQLS